MDLLKDKTVLIVDDDVTIRTIHTKLLNKLGASAILEANDADTALEIIENSAIDLIVSDYIMPNKTGLDLYKSMILSNKHIPFAMVTANSEADAVKEMIDLGINAILVKPLTIEMIMTRISKII